MSLGWSDGTAKLHFKAFFCWIKKNSNLIWWFSLTKTIETFFVTYCFPYSKGLYVVFQDTPDKEHSNHLNNDQDPILIKSCISKTFWKIIFREERREEDTFFEGKLHDLSLKIINLSKSVFINSMNPWIVFPWKVTSWTIALMKVLPGQLPPRIFPLWRTTAPHEIPLGTSARDFFTRQLYLNKS